MRDYKFRGVTHEFSSPSWVYGDLICNSTDEPRIMDDYYDCYEPTTWLVDPETVGQFTGIYDAEGRPIYEGDIVTVEGWRKPTLVEWFDANAQFVIDGSLNLGLRNSFMRVIGNVHDNPELLKGD